MKYFDNCKTVEDVKQTFYKTLLEVFPDFGGSPRDYTSLQRQYLDKLEELGINDNEFSQKIVEALLKCEEAKIEVIGSWIWVFNSKPYADILKKMGFWFSGGKKAWVFSGTNKKRVHYKKQQSIDDIKTKYGAV